RQHPSSAIDPPPQLARGGLPVPLVDSAPQRRRLQPPCTEVEREVHDGRELVVGLGGEHWAVAQRGVEGGAQVLTQEGLAIFFGDGRVVGLAEPAVADGPVAGRAKVRVRPALRVSPGYAVETLEALGEFDGRLGYRDHDRTRSKTRP